MLVLPDEARLHLSYGQGICGGNGRQIASRHHPDYKWHHQVFLSTKKYTTFMSVCTPFIRSSFLTQSKNAGCWGTWFDPQKEKIASTTKEAPFTTLIDLLGSAIGLFCAADLLIPRKIQKKPCLKGADQDLHNSYQLNFNETSWVFSGKLMSHTYTSGFSFVESFMMCTAPHACLATRHSWWGQ